MRTKWRNAARPAALGAVALMLATGCGLPGHAPRGPEPEDAVSVGYGTRSRKDVAASISSASPEHLGRETILRVQDLLESIPGLQVLPLSRGEFTVRIRGRGTGLGHAEPLLIIDDVPVSAGTVGSTLAIVPPQEIVRIDVLKDVASTGVYGVRGANGVIIVTTKRSR